MNLKDLLENKTCLLLGAGASLDYDFPLWNDLSIRLTRLLNDSEQSPYKDYWLEILAEHSEALTKSMITIDQVISLNRRSVVYRNYIVNILQEIISESELEDSNTNLDDDEGWLGVFRTKLRLLLSECVESGDLEAYLRVMMNLKVVSLNYDRAFARHVMRPIAEDLNHHSFLSDTEFHTNFSNELRDFFTIHQPHGSLGLLPVPGRMSGNPIAGIHSHTAIKQNNYGGNSNGTQYGMKPNQNVDWIEVVGEGDLNKNYERLSSAIMPNVQNLIAIGLSPIGISACEIDWDVIPKKISYCGEDVEGYPDGFEHTKSFASSFAESL